MGNDTQSKELTLPEGEQWWSHGFISKIAAQISMPYKRQSAEKIVKRNGNLEVGFVAGKTGVLPYGRYPRLFELWACTMIKTGNECFDPETNTMHLGTTFREFLRMIGVQVGGRQLKSIKPQLENLFGCTYQISNSDGRHTHIRNFVVAREAHIDWLQNEPQERGLFENWVKLSPEYVDMLRDHPVPVDLKVIANLRKPMAIDVYWWLTKRVYNLHEPVTVTWQQLYQQFGSDTATIRKFKQNFKDAVFEVMRVYDCKITLGPQRVTVYPNRTSVPTVMETRAVEKRRVKAAAAKPKPKPDEKREAVEGHWFSFMGSANAVFWTSEAFNANDANNHLFGLVRREECPICAYDQRNRDRHESFAMTLFDAEA